MAISGKLGLGGKSYNVIQAQYEFSQSLDETNKPSSRTRGGTITFVMPATSDDDLTFYKWMFNKTEVKDGIFMFNVWVQNNQKKWKTLMFKNAFCVSLKDYFNNNDSKLMYTTVTISAESITFGTDEEAVFTNEW